MVQVSVARGWDLEVDRGPDWLFVRPLAFDRALDDAPSLGEQIWGLLEQTLTHRLVLELGGLSLDEKLIAQILQLQERVHAHDGIMRVCGLSAENEQLLRSHDVDGQIALYCDREAAVMCQDRPRQPRQPR
ncbi:MAG: hypothetical protein AB7O59_15780 [Pirellulales bacterium]